MKKRISLGAFALALAIGGVLVTNAHAKSNIYYFQQTVPTKACVAETVDITCSPTGTDACVDGSSRALFEQPDPNDNASCITPLFKQ